MKTKRLRKPGLRRFLWYYKSSVKRMLGEEIMPYLRQCLDEGQAKTSYPLEFRQGNEKTNDAAGVYVQRPEPGPPQLLNFMWPSSREVFPELLELNTMVDELESHGIIIPSFKPRVGQRRLLEGDTDAIEKCEGAKTPAYRTPGAGQ